MRHSFLPLSLAWETFEQKNGTPDFETLNFAIRKYRASKGKVEHDPIIGCIILTSPFFFSRDEWMPVPKNWSSNIVQGKTYDTSEPYGQTLWEQVSERLSKPTNLPTMGITDETILAQERYGKEYLTRPRLGQGAFRVLVTEAYERRCAVTGEKTLPVLTAAHIKPYAKLGPHEVQNGLLLRDDLHILFDRGYLTVTEDYHVEVSGRIKEDYGNGREYYAMHGKRLLILPGTAEEQPSKEYLRWHNEEVFVS